LVNSESLVQHPGSQIIQLNLAGVEDYSVTQQYQDEAGEIKSSNIVQASRFYPLQGN
jgi:hypothetical protein